METRINNNTIGGISKAVYVSDSNTTTYYNAGKGGVNYRFLEYGISYLSADPSDFNILENMTVEKIEEFFGTPTPSYDALENLYNTAIPCDIGEETGPDYNNYFGSFMVNQKTVYVFLVPAGVSEIRMYHDMESDSQTDGDLTIIFDSGIETSEGKVVYLSISQVGNGEGEAVRVGWKSWMQLLNPNRKKPSRLLSLSDTRIKVGRVEKRGCAWYDAASGTILGNAEVRGKLLKNKKASVLENSWSAWKSYGEGEKVLYPSAECIKLGRQDLDYITELPKGEVCVYGDCNISDIILLDPNNNSSRSIWFNSDFTELEQTEGKRYKYYSAPNSSLIYRTNSGNSINPVKLREASPDNSCLKFTLPQDTIVRFITAVPDTLSEGSLIIEVPKFWVSLKNNNIGNPPSSISPLWSTNENLTNYYTQVTELYCPGGNIVPSGLINVNSGVTEIGARLKLRPGWGISSEQDNGVEVTQRLETLEDGSDTYYHVLVNKDYYQYWKRKYVVNVDPVAPDITFQFPILYSNSTSGIIYSDGITISEFYRRKNPDNINYGVTINIKEEIKNRSRSTYDSDIPIDDYLSLQDFEITPSFPGMTIIDGVAEIEDVTLYSGQFKFIPANRLLTVLMANSYDFSVSNPYNYVEYGGIVSGLSFRSETGSIPAWIWINKTLIETEDNEFELLKIPLSGLVNGSEEAILIDGSDYGFTKMIITKSGSEYNIKIEDVRNSIKIDIIEA